jgi:hypothetical protein
MTYRFTLFVWALMTTAVGGVYLAALPGIS